MTSFRDDDAMTSLQTPPPSIASSTMADQEPLAVPKQLQTQLAKCKSVRQPDYHKSRDKTPEVRSGSDDAALALARGHCRAAKCFLTTILLLFFFYFTGNQSVKR